MRQLDALARELMTRSWAAGAGPHRRDELLHIDLDSTIAQVHGTAKRGAGFGYTGVGCYHPLLARVSEPAQAGWSRTPGCGAATPRPARAGLISWPRRSAGCPGRWQHRSAAGPRRQRLLDSALVAAARQADVRFSVTARIDSAVSKAIAGIPETAWQPLPYWGAVADDDGTIVASSAEVAQTTYTAFTSTKNPVTARLVVRRVRRLREAATGQPLDQQALDIAVWRYHAMLTDRLEPLPQAEAEHRAHAVVEQSIAELKAGPLAHLPSGQFWANAAWITLVAIAVNLARALATLAAHGLANVTLATLQRTLLAVPARRAAPAAGSCTCPPAGPGSGPGAG